MSVDRASGDCLRVPRVTDQSRNGRLWPGRDGSRWGSSGSPVPWAEPPITVARNLPGTVQDFARGVTGRSPFPPVTLAQSLGRDLPLCSQVPAGSCAPYGVRALLASPGLDHDPTQLGSTPRGSAAPAGPPRVFCGG